LLLQAHNRHCLDHCNAQSASATGHLRRIEDVHCRSALPPIAPLLLRCRALIAVRQQRCWDADLLTARCMIVILKTEEYDHARRTKLDSGCPQTHGLEQRQADWSQAPSPTKARLEGLFTVTTRSLNRVQSLRSMRPGKARPRCLEKQNGKPGERRRHLRYPRRSRPSPHFDAFASAAFSAARAPARMLAMA